MINSLSPSQITLEYGNSYNHGARLERKGQGSHINVSLVAICHVRLEVAEIKASDSLTLIWSFQTIAPLPPHTRPNPITAPTAASKQRVYVVSFGIDMQTTLMEAASNSLTECVVLTAAL